MIERIRLWWKFEGRYYYSDFVYGVKNLIRWFKLIWKDRDWDDHYIWVLIIQKLEFQAKYIGDNDRHTRAKRDAEIIRTCVELMKRVKEEYYESEYMNYHNSDYNFIDCNTPGHKQLQIVQNKEWFDEYFKKYPLVYKKILADKKLQIFRLELEEGETEEDSKRRIAMNISHYNHNRARKILFKLMERNIENWWD